MEEEEEEEEEEQEEQEEQEQEETNIIMVPTWMRCLITPLTSLLSTVGQTSDLTGVIPTLDSL